MKFKVGDEIIDISERIEFKNKSGVIIEPGRTTLPEGHYHVRYHEKVGWRMDNEYHVEEEELQLSQPYLNEQKLKKALGLT